jgi:3,5-epimerase/4-reductase
MHCLVFGAHGWIGQQVCEALRAAGHNAHPAACRVDDEKMVKAYLDELRPTHVLCLIGRTHGPGFPTIDYLEQPGKLVENVRDNLYAPLTLALLCRERRIHMTYMGTGCIFEYDEEHGPRVGFKESAEPNFFGSSYSIVKGFTDRIMHQFEDTVLNLRIRMPITGESHPRNFITKITHYAKVCSIRNSMSVLPTLFPYMIRLMEMGEKGTLNFTNPGVISHNEILGMYKMTVDHGFSWENFTIEEQNAVLASKRSNNCLDTSRLESYFPDVPDIHTAVQMALDSMVRPPRNILS